MQGLSGMVIGLAGMLEAGGASGGEATVGNRWGWVPLVIVFVVSVGVLAVLGWLERKQG